MESSRYSKRSQLVSCDVCKVKMRSRGLHNHVLAKHKMFLTVTQVSKPVTTVSKPVTTVRKLVTTVTETNLVTTVRHYHANCCLCKKQITEKNGLRVWHQVDTVKYPEPGNKFHKKWMKAHEYICRSCSKSEMADHRLSGDLFRKRIVWEAREMEPSDYKVPMYSDSIKDKEQATSR